MPDTTQHLFEQYQHGEDAAADELFYRYLDRLTALARTRLSPALARRIDAEDVVMSAYRSLFIGARDGRIAIQQSGALWALLVKITLRKLYRSAGHHSADKRNVNRDREFDDDQHPTRWIADRQPTPDEAVAVSEALKSLLATLPATERRMLELRLLGEHIEDIAAELGCSERTVRRFLKRVEGKFAANDSAPLPPLNAIDRSVASSPPSGLALSPLAGPLIGSAPPPVDWRNYTLQQQIGFGAMARVYRASDRTTQQTVAVKFLRKQFHNHQLATDRFLREAEIVARMQHPNVVSIFGVGRTPGGGLFIVMDYVAETDHRPESVSVRQALTWTAEAAAGIQHVHQFGLVHCDLKPSNILIADRAIVADFGLACSVTNTCSVTLEGTAAFMAPEQIDSYWGPISQLADVYGLGAVLFHFLTGQPPVTGDKVADILTTTISGRARRTPSALRREIPYAVDEICERCLHRDPKLRFQSAGALLTQLKVVIADLNCG